MIIAATTCGESFFSLFLRNLVDAITHDVFQLGNIVQLHTRPFFFGTGELIEYISCDQASPASTPSHR